MDCSKTLEHRIGAVSVDAAQPRTLYGYAARFNETARIDGSFNERIHAGAFKRSLESGRDILCLVDHDTSKILGRTSSGTLKLSEDAVGLRYELILPNTQEAKDIAELARRGDLGGMSFGFRVPQGGETWDGENRMLSDVELLEISVIHSWPAYDGTSVGIRSKAMRPRLKKLREVLRYV